MAENNDEEVYISFTIEGKRGFSYTITKLPPLIEGLKCIQRYKVTQYLGPERIIYTDDLLFWKRLKNHISKYGTFYYFKSDKDRKKEHDKEILFALLGEDCLGPKTLLDTDTGNSIYIGALIEGEDGHYTVNKHPLVVPVIPYLDEYKDNKDNKEKAERNAMIESILINTDLMVYQKRIIDEKREEQIDKKREAERKQQRELLKNRDTNAR